MRKLILSVLVFAAAFTATKKLTTPQQERYVAVVNKVLPTTVTIYSSITYVNPNTHETMKGVVSGSGVFISPNGHILTCAHLFWKPFIVTSISVETINGWVLPATLVYKEDNRDLSLLKVEDSPSPYAELASPNSLEVGQEVIAIGSPLGFNGTVTTGIISAINRDVIHYDMLQMSAPINPGNSGGPLFNLKGEIVGINTNIYSVAPLPIWSGLGFSVSASEINRFLWTFRGLEKAIHGRNGR